jgi:sugar/nucleoside kinase (ribokinase family)
MNQADELTSDELELVADELGLTSDELEQVSGANPNNTARAVSQFGHTSDWMVAPV